MLNREGIKASGEHIVQCISMKGQIDAVSVTAPLKVLYLGILHVSWSLSHVLSSKQVDYR